MPRRRLSHLACCVALVASGALAAGCSDDPPSRSQFVSELQKITSSKVTAAQASCVYDKISDDPVLLDAALKDASVKLPADIDTKLSKRLAECIVAQRSSGSD